MAAIDKTYISDWNEFSKIREWAKHNPIVLADGTVTNEYPTDFMYEPDITEEEFKERNGIVLWNTPTYVDRFLYFNCPFETVQNRLKEQYINPKEEFEAEIPHIVRKGKDIRFHILKWDGTKYHGNCYISDFTKHSYAWEHWHNRWRMDINPYSQESYKKDGTYEDWSYYRGTWYRNDEQMPQTYNGYSFYPSKMNKKIIKNILRKMNLPAGLVIDFYGPFRKQHIIVKTY